MAAWGDLQTQWIENDQEPLIVDEEGSDGPGLTLADAIALAGSIDYPGPDTIVFAPWIRQVTLDGTELAIASGNDVTIVGPGAGNLTVDAQGLSRVFNISSGVDVSLRGMTITGGSVTGNGGGVRADGDLKLQDVRVTGNEATSQGGGVWFTTTSRVEIQDSTIDGNEAVHGGGVFGHLAFADSLAIDRSTISGNTATGIGGGVHLQRYSSTPGAASIANSTISGNNAAYSGGVRAGFGTTLNISNTTITANRGDWGGGLTLGSSTDVVTLHNTILADNRNAANSADNDFGGAANLQTGSSYNLLRSGSSGGLSATNGNRLLTSGTAGLAPLGDYGGKTRTHALKTGSEALNNGNNSLISGLVDQRGFERPYNAGTADIGAFEAGDQTTLTVRYGTDRNNNSFTTVNPDNLSLREALWLASQLAGQETVGFDPALYAGSAHTLNMSMGALNVADGTRLAGPGADKVILDHNGTGNVMTTSGVTEVAGVTITGGMGYYGSGIQNIGDLTLRGVRVVDNEAAYYGAGIYNTGALRIYDSEISDNVANSGDGGGVYSLATSGTDVLEIVNTTISGNYATGDGGGLYLKVDSGHGLQRIVNSTITGNTASSGGGLHLARYSGSTDFLFLYNSIVADNTAGGDVVGAYVDLASEYNLLRSGSAGGLTSGAGIIFLTGGQSAKLEALGFHGGSTRVHRLKYDSPAVDAGDNSWAATLDLEFDQRGQGHDRIVDVNWDGDGDAEIDIGAVEMAFDEYLT